MLDHRLPNTQLNSASYYGVSRRPGYQSRLLGSRAGRRATATAEVPPPPPAEVTAEVVCHARGHDHATSSELANQSTRNQPHILIILTNSPGHSLAGSIWARPTCAFQVELVISTIVSLLFSRPLNI